MTRLQTITACFSAVLLAALIALCFRDNPSTAAIVVLGVLFAFSLLVTVVDPSRFAEFSVGLLKGEMSFKKATPENVEITLKAVADQEAIEQKDGGQSAQSLEPLVESVEHKDTSARTDADYLTLATDAWRSKKLDDALRFAYAGLERPASDPRITAALYSRLGTIENDLKNPERAEKHYRKAISTHPAFQTAHNNLGILLYELKRFDEAEVSYHEAIRLDPDYAYAHNNLGVLLKGLKRFDEAEDAYREAIRLDPDYVSAHNNLGVLLKGLKRFDEAELSYREAIRLNPDHASAHNNLGVLLKSLKRFDEAELSYREAIRLDPEYARAHNNLGDLLKNLGKTEEAETMFAKAREIGS